MQQAHNPLTKTAIMRPNLPTQGRMLEMQMRVREKEAKRKNIDAESLSKKKKCDREERIAGVQLKAYWELYPLRTGERQAEHLPLPESDDDELIEDRSQCIGNANEMGSRSESEQELIDEVQCNIHQNVIADHLRSSIRM